MVVPPPLVSVCCLTYNHAPFVRRCLDGFLIQKTNFPIEILIHDDCSMDGTDGIIREYAEKYPEVVFPLFEIENKYSNGYRGKMNTVFNYSRARGKYIAYCEGDDYWTDPYKLQKQVDFMEDHPDYSVCFTKSTNYNYNENRFFVDNCGPLFSSPEQEFVDVNIKTYLQSWVTQPLTMMFRLSILNKEWCDKYTNFRDTHFIFHLLIEGKCAVLNFDSAVYILHNGGVHSLVGELQDSEEMFDIYRELYTSTGVVELKQKIVDTTLWMCDCYKHHSLESRIPKAIIGLFKTSPQSAVRVVGKLFKRKVKSVLANIRTTA